MAPKPHLATVREWIRDGAYLPKSLPGLTSTERHDVHKLLTSAASKAKLFPAFDVMHETVDGVLRLERVTHAAAAAAAAGGGDQKNSKSKSKSSKSKSNSKSDSDVQTGTDLRYHFIRVLLRAELNRGGTNWLPQLPVQKALTALELFITKARHFVVLAPLTSIRMAIHCASHVGAAVAKELKDGAIPTPESCAAPIDMEHSISWVPQVLRVMLAGSVFEGEPKSLTYVKFGLDELTAKLLERKHLVEDSVHAIADRVKVMSGELGVLEACQLNNKPAYRLTPRGGMMGMWFVNPLRTTPAPLAAGGAVGAAAGAATAAASADGGSGGGGGPNSSAAASSAPVKGSIRWHDTGAAGAVMLMDNREGGGDAKSLHPKCKAIETERLTYRVMPLTIADYCFVVRRIAASDRAVTYETVPLLIERKTFDDLAAAIHTGRHASQRERLLKIKQRLNWRVVYLIEGGATGLSRHWAANGSGECMCDSLAHCGFPNVSQIETELAALSGSAYGFEVFRTSPLPTAGKLSTAQLLKSYYGVCDEAIVAARERGMTVFRLTEPNELNARLKEVLSDDFKASASPAATAADAVTSVRRAVAASAPSAASSSSSSAAAAASLRSTVRSRTLAADSKRVVASPLAAAAASASSSSALASPSVKRVRQITSDDDEPIDLTIKRAKSDAAAVLLPIAQGTRAAAPECIDVDADDDGDDDDDDDTELMRAIEESRSFNS